MRGAVGPARVEIDPSVRSLLLAIMREFPLSAARMRACARAHRSVVNSTTDMMETFAADTRRAVKRGDLGTAGAHMASMAHHLRHADPVQRQYIDVYYVEGLMFELSPTDQDTLWSLMPASLRSLWEKMWGAR